MRWVWRAESGASALEYVGLVVLAAALITAILSVGMPTKIQPLLEQGLCVVMGQEGCEVQAGGPTDGDSSGEDSDNGDGDGDQSSGEKADPTTDGDSGDEDGDGADSDSDSGDGDGGQSEGENVAYDPELAKKYQDAQKKADKAEDDYGEAQSDYKDLSGDLLQLVSELIGIEDAKNCFTKGDVAGCIFTALNLIPWTKLGRLGSKVPKAIRFANKFRKLSKAKKAAKAKLTKTQDKLKGLRKKCKTGGKRNSFLAGTPVVLADGRRVDIADIDTGDEVLATNPTTGVTRSAPVTDTITGTGAKDLVTVAVFTSAGSETMTATAGHPFWVASQHEWVEAGDLRPGDTLRTPTGTTTVANLSTHTQHQTVHNLTIAGAHTYYAGPTAPFLVHNKGGSACGVPGGTLARHEKLGGHTIDRHVGKDEKWLKRRVEKMKKDPKNKNRKSELKASSFADRSTAESTISNSIKKNKNKIEKWMKDPENQETVIKKDPTGKKIGKTVNSEGKTKGARKVTIILRKDKNSSTGYRVHTAYPE